MGPDHMIEWRFSKQRSFEWTDALANDVSLGHLLTLSSPFVSDASGRQLAAAYYKNVNPPNPPVNAASRRPAIR